MKKLLLPLLVLTLFSACNDKGGNNAKAPSTPPTAKQDENTLLVASSCPVFSGLYRSADGKESSYVKLEALSQGHFKMSLSESESAVADSAILIDGQTHQTPEGEGISYSAQCVEENSILVTFIQDKDSKSVGTLKYTKLDNSLKIVSSAAGEEKEEEVFLVY